MKITVIATTKPNHKTPKKEFDLLGGYAAGICYMPSTFDEILNEKIETTEKRIRETQVNGHHSVYDHSYIMLYLDQVPKLLAMLINNERMYTTSEKSARYTKMEMKGIEKDLYYKWLKIFKNEIVNLYGDTFTNKQIEKLAQENSRYIISVMTPTSAAYTVSYRQLNYIYGWIKKMLEIKDNVFVNLLRPSLIEFAKELEKTGYLEKNLYPDNKNRTFSLFKNEHKQAEYFGDVYCTTYVGSLAQVAQALRHRTLSYSIAPIKETNFFIPPIISDNKKLVDEWLNDMATVAHLFPQGTLVSINERGTYEDFILKTKERLCTHAQLEICIQTRETLLKYKEALKNTNHYLHEDILKYTKGAKCTFPDFECSNDCNFKEGKILTRKI